MTRRLSLGVAASLEGVKIVLRFVIRFIGLAWHLCASQLYNGCLTLCFCKQMCGNGVRCVGKYLAEITKAKAPKR